jgi:hypothetical protein
MYLGSPLGSWLFFLLCSLFPTKYVQYLPLIFMSYLSEYKKLAAPKSFILLYFYSFNSKFIKFLLKWHKFPIYQFIIHSTSENPY